MNQTPRIRSASALAVLALLGACASTGNAPTNADGGRLVDYRGQAVKTPPLEVPPDLTQLSREGRFNVQGGQAPSVSASTFGQPGAAQAGSASAGAASLPAVTPSEVGQVRLVREGASRRLVTPLAPEVVYQRALAFWKESGFTIETERPEAGVIETGWAENRAKLPQDFIRNLLGRFADGLFSTGERDRYRTRIERTPQGTELVITHRGLTEVVGSGDRSGSGWQPRASDPALEAEFTYRLMSRLGAPEAQVQQARASDAAGAGSASTATAPRAAGSAAAAAVAQADRARALPDGRVEINEGFDRAWRRLGLALDRSGFTVEDRDRAGGIYFVRYIDKNASPNPGMLDRVLNIFRSDDSKVRLARYRIVLKGDGESRSTLSVLNQSGQPDSSAAARQVIDLLLKELR